MLLAAVLILSADVSRENVFLQHASAIFVAIQKQKHAREAAALDAEAELGSALILLERGIPFPEAWGANALYRRIVAYRNTNPDKPLGRLLRVGPRP